jgi:hypothetical protein
MTLKAEMVSKSWNISSGSERLGAVNSFYRGQQTFCMMLLKNYYIDKYSSGQKMPDSKVVLVRRLVTWVLGIWRGEGVGNG